MFKRIKKFSKELLKFIRDVANDPRIPERDKKVLLTMVALIASPIDLIPDWIPVFGQIDDVIIIALILDYLFRVLDAEVLLSHYPWDMKSFAKLKRVASFASSMSPGFLKNRLWQYTGSPYK